MSVSNFAILSKVGEGSFAVVYKARRYQDNCVYALKKVKILTMSQKERQNALTEVRLLASITHPNILGFKEAFIEDDYLYLVTEFCESGDLAQLIQSHKAKNQPIDESKIWDIFTQLAQGLQALHELKIVHRDIKSANIFFSEDGTVKIGDLNISKIAKTGLLRTQLGTPYYASPEVWKERPYDYKTDIWSLGCVIYELTALEPPFTGSDMSALYRKVLSGHFKPIPITYSRELTRWVNSLLKVNAAQRPTAEEIMTGLGASSRHHSPPLMNTIVLPKNLSQVKLPSPRYRQHTPPNSAALGRALSDRKMHRIFQTPTRKVTQHGAGRPFRTPLGQRGQPTVAVNVKILKERYIKCPRQLYV